MEPHVSITPAVCPTCHMSVKSEYYFCPNCGTKLNAAPLSTSTGTQIKLYLFSIILPMIGFLLVTRWKGYAYFKSKDSHIKQIGEIAIFLLVLSTIGTIWYAIVWTQNYVQQTVNSINSDFSGQGF